MSASAVPKTELLRLLAPGTDPDVAASYQTLAERSARTVLGFEDEIAFVDIETTGFDPTLDRVIEIAVVVARGPDVATRFSTLVDPGVEIPFETTRLTGIDGDMLVGAPCAGEAVARLAEVVGGRDIVAHNVSFDRSFLTAAGGESAFPGSWIDSLELARIALPRLRSHRLRDLAPAFGIGTQSHRASDDAEALAVLWRVMLTALVDLPPEAVAALAGLARETDWPLRHVLAHVAAGRRSAPFDLRSHRAARVGDHEELPLMDAADVETSCSNAAEVLDEFTEKGVAGRMYPLFEPRTEQGRMAEAVLGAFDRDVHLAVEAGTGVGKSVAYLLPASRFAMGNRVGVGVATKTNSLTDQLVFGELPALDAGLGGGLRYVSLKGYEHYPCLRKLERLARDPSLGREKLVAVAMLIAWVAQTTWGELGSLNLHWSREIRSAVACSVAECTRRRCRFYRKLCYLHGLRACARSAHVVVTNHALLFRDLVSGGGILPPIRHWIIDEAHAVEAEARSQLSLSVGQVDLAGALRSLHASGRGGLLAAARTALRARESSGTLQRVISEMESTVETATTLTGSFFDSVKDLSAIAPATDYDRTEMRITRGTRDTGVWGSAAGIGRSLARRLQSLLEHGRALVTGLEELGPGDQDVRADIAGLLSRLADAAEALAVALDGEDERYVYSATVDRRRDVTAERLTAAPVDVGALIAEALYPNTRSVTYTSATIAVGDDFSHFARGVGLDRLPEASWTALRLPSSYDFERQMAVFVPSDLEEPGSPSYPGHLERLLEEVHLAMGGSVLTLFTNRRDMEALYRRLAPRLGSEGLDLLVQKDTLSAKRLRDEFIADERLSLFATKSFWEGFDAKGDTLRCVVIPRLPFGQLADPLLEERRDRDRGWWEHYYLPEAIIELKQAAGRLIRSSTDMGCLVIGDTRLVGDKAYGRRFLEVLPVRDVEVLPTSQLAEEIATRFGRAGT